MINSYVFFCLNQAEQNNKKCDVVDKHFSGAFFSVDHNI